MKFNERLREVREDKFISKTDLAKVLSTSRQQILKYETGFSVPSIDVLLKIADYLSISADYLLGRDEYVTLPRDKKQSYLVLPKELTKDEIEFSKELINVLRRKHIKKPK
ncbi:MAG: helix-turn-helix domain-containing protein [Eubacterium sp.]|jgi:transcriptional regulator with XRE-family HTH domain|nr:helix-turn-helix domain-containing protein [Eubacterium sp.]